MPAEAKEKGKKVLTLAEMKRLGIIKMGNDSGLISERIPINIPQLNELLGGGVPRGKGIQFFGEESTGKTLGMQIMIAAIQQSATPDVLVMDQENTYDEAWWRQSGVDTEKLMVSRTDTTEQAIDVIRGVLLAMGPKAPAANRTLGAICIDSIAALIPQVEMVETKSSEDSRMPGAQAKAITFMYHQIGGTNLGNQVALISTNQLRDSPGYSSEMSNLPGGRANRHYNHIFLRTRRDSWILGEGGKPVGYIMEITSRKNKTCTVPDGTDIKIPILADSQISWTMQYIEEARRIGIITVRGPYFYFGEIQKMGMQALRTFFTETPEAFEQLRLMVDAANTVPNATTES